MHRHGFVDVQRQQLHRNLGQRKQRNRNLFVRWRRMDWPKWRYVQCAASASPGIVCRRYAVLVRERQQLFWDGCDDGQRLYSEHHIKRR